MFERGAIDIDSADDKQVAQLGALKWTDGSLGRRKIESKDDTRKRGLPSPDRADALCMYLVDVDEAGLMVETDGEQSITRDLLTARG